MKIVMDYDLCQGHAVCMGEAPEVFHVGPKGEHTVLLEEPPEDLREKVEAAIEYCPTGAISLLD